MQLAVSVLDNFAPTFSAAPVLSLAGLYRVNNLELSTFVKADIDLVDPCLDRPYESSNYELLN